MKPIILITCGSSTKKNGTKRWILNKNYFEMIAHAGGIPIVVTDQQALTDYVRIADGLILSGGKDVVTERYGQACIFPAVSTDPERDNLEWALLNEFIPTKKPIFGICRGLQVLNVYLGGSLYQDLLSQLGGEHEKGINHKISIKQGSFLNNMFGESMVVNSYHHQGIDSLAPGFIPIAWSNASNHQLVEAFEHESLPILGVQWHPERM